MLSGEVEQWVGGENQILKGGEVAHMLPGVVPATFNRSNRDAVILAILSPGSQSGPFMVAVSGDEPWVSLHSTHFRNSDGRQPIHLQKVLENVNALSKPTALAMTSTLSSVIDNRCRAR